MAMEASVCGGDVMISALYRRAFEKEVVRTGSILNSIEVSTWA